MNWGDRMRVDRLSIEYGSMAELREQWLVK